MIKNINRVVLAMSMVSGLVCIDVVGSMNAAVGSAIVSDLTSKTVQVQNLSKNNTDLKEQIISLGASLSSWRLYTAFFAIVAIVEGFYLFDEYFDYVFDEESAPAENDSAHELPACEAPESSQSSASATDEQPAVPTEVTAETVAPEQPTTTDLPSNENLSTVAS